MPANIQPAQPDRAPPDIRQRIEGAVLDLFSEREFHRVQLAEVARHARVSLRTLYKYYGDKETLLYACLDRWMSELTDRMIDHLQGITTYKDRLRKLYWVCLDFFERNPRVAQLIATSAYIAVWRRHESFRQAQVMATLLRVLEEGQRNGTLTTEVGAMVLLDFFFGVVHRLVMMWILRGREHSLTNQADAEFEMLWRALAAPSDG